MSAAPSRGRVLPHNLEAEQCGLGGCLLRPDAAADVLEDATPELFYSPVHRLICQALLSTLADGAPVDLITVTDRMTTLGTLNKAGGLVYLAELAILAGRPGTGKIALALCEAAHFLRKGHPGGIFSLELRSSRLAQRFSAQQASVDAQRFRDGRFTDEGMGKVLNGVDGLAKKDELLRCWDRPSLTPQELHAQVRKWKREIGIQWIVIDYMQKLRGDGRYSSREQEVANVSRGIVETAKEYDWPCSAWRSSTATRTRARRHCFPRCASPGLSRPTPTSSPSSWSWIPCAGRW